MCVLGEKPNNVQQVYSVLIQLYSRLMVYKINISNMVSSCLIEEVVYRQLTKINAHKIRNTRTWLING